MSVYPYEVPIHIMPAHSGKSGAASIIYKKELSKKIPGKGGCKVWWFRAEKTAKISSLTF